MALLAFSKTLPMFILVAIIWGMGNALLILMLITIAMDRGGSDRGPAMGTYTAIADLGTGLGSCHDGPYSRLDQLSSYVPESSLSSASSISYISNFLSGKKEGVRMPIYEYRCEDCGKISEFLMIKTDDKVTPQCNRCKSKKMSRVLSRVKGCPFGGESNGEASPDPAKWGDLDEKDPKSVARMMKRMGKEMGEDMDMNMDEMEQAIEEEMASPKPEGGSEE